MASVSARFSVPVGFPVRVSNTNQRMGKCSCLVSLFWQGTCGFPSIRTSRFQISASKPETVQKVSDIVRKQLALAPEITLTPQTKFTELGADSLDTVEIVMGLEEVFDINVEEESSDNITTIQEAADMIDKLLERRN